MEVTSIDTKGNEMAIDVIVCNVYKSNGRRYFTKNAAIRAEAIAIIKRKYPTEKGEFIEGYGYVDNGFHWSQLPNSSKLLKRLMKKIKQSVSVQCQANKKD